MKTAEKFLGHAPCENCGSRDNLGIYENHTYCFGCHEFKVSKHLRLTKEPEQVITDMIIGNIERLDKRKINEETCKVFNYEVGECDGRPVQIANYYDKNYNKVAQKLRYPDKSFKWVGDTDKITLFGQQNWRDGGRTIVITEGELDA